MPAVYQFVPAVSGATGVTLDKQGNIYVAGSTSSANFTTVTPVQGQLGTAPMLTSTDGGKTWTSEALGTAIGIEALGRFALLLIMAAAPDSSDRFRRAKN